MNDRLKDMLVRERTRFEVIPHREAFTAQERAEATQITGQRLAKVIVVRDDDWSPGHPWFALAVLPAASGLDLPQLQGLTGRPHLTLARENEFAPLFPDCAPGAMPPFGGLYGLGVSMDRALASEPDLAFEGGTHNEEIRMPTTEFLRMERPIVASLRAA